MARLPQPQSRGNKVSTNVMTMGERSVPAGETLALDRLLDPEEVSAILGPVVTSSGRKIKSCRIGHVRYHPFTGCTVSYRIKYHDHDNNDILAGSFYAKCCSPGLYNRLQLEAAGRPDTQSEILNSALAVPEWHTLFFQFPNDLKIPSLQLLARPQSIREILSPVIDRNGGNGSIRLQPLRYKPESRLIAICHLSDGDESPSVVLRFDRPGRSRAVFDLVNRLRSIFSDQPGIDFPQPLFVDDERGLTAVEVIEGSKLSDLLQGEDAELHIRRTARTLAVLHSCTDPDLPRYRQSSHLEKAINRASLLRYAGEQIATPIATISDRLKPLAYSIDDRFVTLVHGDFHQGQLLRSGEKDWIIDMDRSGLGDPIADLGNFVAQLTVLQFRKKLAKADLLIQALLDEYQQVGGKVVSPDRLKFWKVLGLLELAAKDFRRLKPSWPVSVPAILNECQAVLDR